MQNIVFGGLLLTASSANGVIAWAMELSFFFHTYEILMVNGECQKKAAVFPQSTSIYLSISCIDIIYLHWLLFFLRLTNTVIDCLYVCRVPRLRPSGIQPLALIHGRQLSTDLRRHVA